MTGRTRSAWSVAPVALLVGGCLSLDGVTVHESPVGDDTPADSLEDAAARRALNGAVFWLGTPYVRPGDAYLPVAPRDVVIDPERFVYPSFDDEEACVVGPLETLELDQQPGGFRTAELTRAQLLGQLDALHTPPTGLDLAYEVQRFALHVALDGEPAPGPSISAMDGPVGIDKAALYHSVGEATPTAALCEHGYAERIILGARFQFAFRFSFASEKGRLRFVSLHGADPIDVLGTVDDATLLASARETGMHPGVTVGVLQVGGHSAPRLTLDDSGCHTETAEGLLACRRLLAELRDHGQRFMESLHGQATVSDWGGYVPVGAWLAQRTW